MITKELAVLLRRGVILHHKYLANKDGTSLRCRVNGRCTTREKRPDSFRLPVKYGLRECFYITNKGVSQGKDWFYPYFVQLLADLAGLKHDTPPGIIRDKLLEMDRNVEAGMLEDIVSSFTITRSAL